MNILKNFGDYGIFAPKIIIVKGKYAEMHHAPNCAVQKYVVDTSRVQERRMKLVEFNKIVYSFKVAKGF